MERDFMGLNHKEPLAVVKEEITETSTDPGVQWPFMNRMNAISQFMSGNFAQEERSKKNIVAGPFGSSAFVPISEIQKNSSQDRQGETPFLVTAYPTSFKPIFRPHSVVDATMKQLLGEAPVTAPHLAGSIPGNNFKASEGSAQLTIFYAGAVNVYDDISPERAQAIMLLAGNPNTPMVDPDSVHPRAEAQGPTSKATPGDGGPVNTPPNSGFSSPLSVSSHPKNNPGNAPTTTGDIMIAKSTGVTAMVSLGSSVAVPPVVTQARNASLARFLEKRRERVMSKAPYNIINKSPECASSLPNGTISSACSASLQA